jgi:hypothetical protein
MKKIYKIEEVPNEEKIYLTKSILGWKVVYPLKNEDGSYNWFNVIFGSWENIIYVAFILFLIYMFYLAYHEVSYQLTDCMKELNQTHINYLLGGITN